MKLNIEKKILDPVLCIFDISGLKYEEQKRKNKFQLWVGNENCWLKTE